MMNCMSNKMRVKCLLSVDGNVVQQFLYQYIDFVHMPMHPIKKTQLLNGVGKPGQEWKKGVTDNHCCGQV